MRFRSGWLVWCWEWRWRWRRATTAAILTASSPAPTPVPAGPDGQRLFFDDFDSGEMSLWEPAEGQWDLRRAGG